MRIYALKPSLSLETSIECDLLRTLKPHTSPVVTSAIDRTGTLLATGAADGIIKVWDIRGGFVTHTFHGHNGVISALKFFELDTSNQQIEATSKKRKRKANEHDETELQTNAETTLGFRLASGGEDGKVRIWNLRKRTSVAVLDSHVSVVRCLDYSPEENALLSASRDKTVIVWDVRTWKIRSTIPVLEEVESSGFLKDGTFVYTGGETARLRLWTTDTQREITQEQPIGTETEAIQEIIYHRGFGFLLSAHADQTLLFHSISPLDGITVDDKIPPLPILRRVSGTYGQVIDIDYVGPAKDLLALATNDEAVRIVSISSAPREVEEYQGDGSYFGAEVGLLKGHSDIVICMDVDWSGHWLATGAKDNTARLWQLEPASNSYACYAIFTGHAESLGAVALPHIVPETGSTAYGDPLSHPPSFLITGSQDQTVKRWEIPNTSKEKDGKKSAPRATYTRKAHDKDINAISTSSSGQLFASASQDRTVKIWTVEDGSTIGVLRGHRRGVWSVAFSPQATNLHISGASNGSSSRGYVLTGSGDKTVRIWSLLDYSCLMTMEGHTNSVLKVLWLPPATNEEQRQHDKRGPLVGSAGGDGLVKIWEAQSGECSATLDNHADRVWALAVRPPTAPESTIEESLVSGAGDGVITFWKDTTNATAEEARAQESRRVELDQKLSNYMHGGNWHDAIALALQLDQPGKLLALFKSVVEADTFEKDSWTGKKVVDNVIASLADEQIYRLLLRCRDWNTNAKNALVAQRVLRAVVENFDGEKLSNLRFPRQKGRTASLRDVLEGLRAYSERHFSRVSDLWDESFLLEFTLREMDEVIVPDVNGSGSAEDVLTLE
jgi:U3 small nucleolar RNA-associated protein 13